jgi:signal peptidase I
MDDGDFEHGELDHEQDEEPGTLREVLVTVAAALLLAWLVQAYVVKPFRIPSGSMENTLRCGDRVLVNRLAYRYGSPHRGDVVVFHPPASVDHGKADPSVVAGEGAAAPRDANGNRTVTAASVNYIKRIIGLPGDKVEVRSNHAWVDGKELDEPYLHPLPKGGGISADDNWGPYVVPQGTYLMLGDHRDNSADGRVFGFVPRQFLVGKAIMVYWPLQRFGTLPTTDQGGTSDAHPDSNCLESVPGQS